MSYSLRKSSCRSKASTSEITLGEMPSNFEEEETEDIVERDYQTVLAEQAMFSNKILFLPTGSGKTFIAILVVKKMIPSLKL